MHLRMEFDSGVGPTCLDLVFYQRERHAENRYKDYENMDVCPRP